MIQQNGSERQQLSEDELLIKYIEDKHPDLVKKAQKQVGEKYDWYDKPCVNSIKLWLVKVFTIYILEVVFVNPRKIDGEAFASEGLTKDAEITAGIISGANLLNAITNWPIIYYAFKNFTIIPPWITTPIIEIIVLSWSNSSGTAAANAKSGKRRWAYLAAFWFILMSILQSVVAGIGAELINNQTQLQLKKAEEVIDNYKKEYMEAFKPENDPKYQETKSRCAELQKQLADLPFNHPDRDSLFLEAYGRWDERNKDWSQESSTNIPVCHKQGIAEQRERNAQKGLDKKLNSRNEIGNDLIFLKKELPALYSLHFTERYGRRELQSGAEAVRLAYENFFRKFNSEEWPGLGFSLFFFLLSIITSLGACFIGVAHAWKRNTQKSRDYHIQQAIKDWLEQMRRDNLMRHKRLNYPDLKQANRERRMINLFKEEYMRTGECDYSVLEEIAAMAKPREKAKKIEVLLPQDERIFNQIDIALKKIYQAGEAIKSEKNLRSKIPEITEGTYSLVYLARQYALSSNYTKQKPNQAGTQVDDVDGLIEEIEETRKDLKNYKTDKKLTDDQLDKKLDILLWDCYELASITRHKINERIPDNKFKYIHKQKE